MRQNFPMDIFKKLFIVLLVLCSVAQAEANIVGSDLENFNPTTDGLGYVTVESADILEPGRFNLGLFLDYSLNILPVTTNSTVTPDDRLTTSNIHGALGIMKGWSLGFSLTNLVSEESNNASFATQFAKTGQEAFRIDSKVRLISKKASNLTALIGVNFNRVNNNPYLGASPGPSVMIGGSYEQKMSQTFRWALNLSYRARNAGEAVQGFAILPIKNQILYSAGMNYHLLDWKTYLIAELYGAYALDEPTNNTDREFSILEALVGAKWKLRNNIDFHMGATRGVYRGISTPDFRVYGGLNWYFGPIWGDSVQRDVPENTDSDGDGIYDAQDNCPDTDYGTRVDQFGCAVKDSIQSEDDDNDGVANEFDECPSTPYGQEVNGVGCEVVTMAASGPLDTDGDGVNDDYDLCPGTSYGVKVTSRGCEAQKIQKFDLGILNFISGTSRLTKKSRARFIKKLNKLNKVKKRIQKIFIEGHTDNVGKAAYNLRLSKKRARAVRKILLKQLKIAKRKVIAKGYGETRPIRTNKTKRGRLVNRRVEMNLILK